MYIMILGHLIYIEFFLGLRIEQQLLTRILFHVTPPGLAEIFATIHHDLYRQRFQVSLLF